MKTTAAVGKAQTLVRPAAVRSAQVIATARLAFMDNLRYLMVLFVIAYHAVAAYAVVAPHWIVHDTPFFGADIIRELLDVFMMPVLFFVAGYFALVSLEKKGVLEFLKDKIMRLLVPWALAVLVIAPLALYDQPVKPIRPFWNYWLRYLGQFQVQLRPSETPVGPTTQMIYWFISLLFAFCLVLALVYALALRARGTPHHTDAHRTDSPRAVLTALLAFGVATSIAYSVLLLFVPDSSWFTLHLFLEFQVTRLVPYAGCFALGVYAQSRGWFVESKGLAPHSSSTNLSASAPAFVADEGVAFGGSLPFWALASVGLAVAYLVFGQPMFADTAGAAHPSIEYLIIFAFLRSFLLLSLLVVLISFGIRYWNVSNRLDRALGSTSYNIYLVHFFILLGFQAALLGWVGGAVPAKIAVVFLGTLALSFALSRWILARHSRAFAIAILALFAFCLAVRP
jgi:glucans biosynthesis protein C